MKNSLISMRIMNDVGDMNKKRNMGDKEAQENKEDA